MKRRTFFVVAFIICLSGAIACFWIARSGRQTPQSQSEDYAPSRTGVITTTSVHEQTSTTVPVEPPYTSPVDFESLQEINPDIYAWIRIPGTSVDYPIVQSATDDSFYLDHDSDKNYNVNGAIFSEHQYNRTDFTDSVTVLYGHNMASGAMFGDFQSLYWDREFLLENDSIEIYLPDREMTFEICAALPYSRMHLLHYYHTEKEKPFNMFVDDLFSARTLSGVLIEERKPSFGDQVLVLSTCLSGDNRYRYLVIGVCKNNS